MKIMQVLQTLAWLIAVIIILIVVVFVLLLIYRRDILIKVKNQMNQNQTCKLAIRVSFVIILLVASAGIFYFFKSENERSTNSITETFGKRDSIIEKSITSDTLKLPQTYKLREQYSIISEIKKPYLIMAKKFNTFDFAFTFLFTLTTIVTAILGFLLLREGWAKNRFPIKASFLIAFFCATLFGTLPKVFNTKENTKNNLTKYNYYSGLQVEIYDLIKDNKGYISRNTHGSIDTLNSIISTINKSIKDNQDLYFDIFIDKVPTDIKPLK